MKEEKTELKKEDRSKDKKFFKLNPVKFGLALGIILAIIVFITTLASILDFFLIYNAVMNDIYNFLGIQNQWINVFLWPIYAFIDGFIFGWIFIKLYNWLLVYKKIPEIAANMNKDKYKETPKEHFKGPLKK